MDWYLLAVLALAFVGVSVFIVAAIRLERSGK